MCHVVLAMPVLGLSLFWILPFDLALPIYMVILIASIIVYYAIMKSMRTPVTTGSEGLIGEIGNFIGLTSGEKLVRIHGEIWNASSPENIKPGEEIRVVNVNGLHLLVERIKRK